MTEEPIYVIPYQKLRLADGSTLIKPGKPLEVAGARVTARLTGLSARTLARLAETGFIRCAFPTPRIPQYWPGEVLEFIRQTAEDPDYWTAERRLKYGMARRSRERKKPGRGRN